MSFGDSEDKGPDQGQKGKKPCQCNGTYGHTTDECVTLKTLVEQVKVKRSKLFDNKKGSPRMK